MPRVSVSGVVADYWTRRSSIVGAFWDIDFLLFDQVLRSQADVGIHGDLLEIGVYYGKSAITLGLHARDSETVYLCDIFEGEAADAANAVENEASYPGLTRSAFEKNYASWVGREPLIIAELSHNIANHIPPGTLRFAHVDGGHLYDIVRVDIANTRGLLSCDGIIVMDDFRARHTPGVAAAVWEAVAADGLIPICASEQKFYGTWNFRVADELRVLLTRWVSTSSLDTNFGRQRVAGNELLLIANPEPRTTRQRVGRRVPQVLKNLRHRGGRPHLGI